MPDLMALAALRQRRAGRVARGEGCQDIDQVLTAMGYPPDIEDASAAPGERRSKKRKTKPVSE